MLGPLLRVMEGDTLEVLFRNNLPFGATMHTHGLFYFMHSEGAIYEDSARSVSTCVLAATAGWSHHQHHTLLGRRCGTWR